MSSSFTARLRQAGWLPLALLLAARLSVGLTYSLLNPPWEAYDEDGHFAYARYLAQRRTLLQPGDPEAEQIWEKFQPPLYYILIAPALMPFDLGAALQLPERNPFLSHGDAGVNYALHPDHLTGVAAQSVWAMYAARLVGVLVSTLSVLFVYRTARQFWPADPRAAWAATVLYAFWPQFLFIGGMVTNDVLAIVLAAASVQASVALAQDGFHLRRALWLGLCLAGALMTKLNAFALLPMSAWAIWLSLRPTTRPGEAPVNWRLPLAWLSVAGLVALLVAAVVALNSLQFVTAQVFQAQTVAEFLRLTREGEVAQRSTPIFVWTAIQYGFRTFFASFGWGNLEAQPAFYLAWGVGAGLAVLGLGRQRLGSNRAARRAQAGLGLLSLHVIALLGLALALAISRQDVFLVPGRYLLPGLPAVSCLLVGGWRALLPASRRTWLWKAIGVGLVLTGWAMPLWTITPAYLRPPPLAGQVEVESHAVFGDNIELLGYNHAESATAGEAARVELCWQARAPITRNYPVFLEVVGPDGQGYGRLATYPGQGNYATSLWTVNAPFCEPYTITLGEAIPAPSAAAVQVAMLTSADVNGERLPVHNATGEPLDLVAIPIIVHPSAPRRPPSPTHRVEYRFGEALNLNGYDYEFKTGPQGEPGVLVRLYWEARANLVEDYIVFVHLRDTPTNAYAQSDTPPRNGWYPTSLWKAGEHVVDEHWLALPEGPAPPLDLYVGVVRTDRPERLRAFGASGERVTNDEVVLEKSLVGLAK